MALRLGSGHITASLVLIGVALRVWAYAANTSLWLDEILLSRNILDLPLGRLLTEPLQLDQVAPRGFLLVEKVAVTVLGSSELALRAFPFLCSIAGLLVFRTVAERALEGVAVPLAVGLVAIGVPFLKFAAEVKQYGIDATATTVLLLLALDLRERDASARRLLLAGAAGFVVIWFSQASVLVMAGIGAATLVEWVFSRDRRTWRMLAVTIPMWALASIVGLIAGVRSMTPSTREFMQDFWRTGFFPLPFRSLADLQWFWERMSSIFSDPTLLRYPAAALCLVVTVCGVAALWRRRFTALSIAGPVVVTLIAAVFQQYPFRGRLLMFLVPLVLLAAAAGVGWIHRIAATRSAVLAGAALVVMLVPPVAALVRTPPPYEVEHYDTVLRHLQQNRQPGDVIYVFPLTRVGTAFYGPRYGLQPHEWTTGVCDREQTRPYVLDVDRFRGAKRFWLLTSGARVFRVARPAVQQYLATIGTRRDVLQRPSPTMGVITLELYDLSDPVRLASADAATFPVDPMPTDPPPGCRPWQRPDAPGSLR